jgi:glycosyltransferase involved in cell wall biosynthesis
MRVLMFGWEFPPYSAGGLATATHGLVKGLLRRGVDVTLVVPFPVEGSSLPALRLVSAARLARLRRVRVPSPLTAYGTEEDYVATYRERVAGTAGAAVYGRNLFDEVERLAAVAGEIAVMEPHDVIHVHDWITYRAGMRAREASGRPLVAHIHATEFDRTGDAPNDEIAHREWEGLTAADHVISNSHTLKQQVTRRYAIPADKITVVHWGIDEEQQRWDGHQASPLPPREPVVLFLGRVTRQKGPDYFIEVARRVVDFVPEARFVVAGTGDMVPRIIERTVELGLSERVHFAGAVGGPDVDRAFRMASVCVMPSVSEPFGLVALESLRAGTPCIVPRISGVAEVLRNTFKVDFWDVEEMTNKIVAILQHPELHGELSELGRAEVTRPRFSLDEPARLTEEVYRRAVGRGEARE